jgi:glycosyltransferase involved in cell wall biosynthesis
MSTQALDIAFVSYSEQSGVTDNVLDALIARGHAVTHVRPTGPLEHRDPKTRALRMTPQLAFNLALAAARFGPRRALYHASNTGYAFDLHSERAGRLLAALERPPDVVLQSGVLFSPGAPPRLPYVLQCDYTAALAAQASGAAAEHAVDLGDDWRRRERAVYLGASAIATFSERVARSLVRDYGVPRDRIAVVGGGANVFPPRVERRDDGKTILFIGKEFERKGGPLLLDAFARLRRRMPEARLLVVGAQKPPPLPDGAASLGRVPLADLPRVCARASVFSMPTHREPYGLAFLDAMACGLPCVGPRAEAVPEIIDDGATGLLVPPADAAALAEALEALLRDPARAAAMGARGRAKVEAGMTWGHVAARLEAVLAAATGGGRRPPVPRPGERAPLGQPTLPDAPLRGHPATHGG